MAFTKAVRKLAGISHIGAEFWRSGARGTPERIVLGVEAGVTPSRKPPVRIFLGTEPRQYRAERVFVWSVLQVRDPARVYEIYLMKDIAGFDRRMWLTGFTNYRFAIPHWAGRTGRAIYNDVDQTYHGDPAELFDVDMAGHGYLAVTAKLTAVMLIDCERMASVWGLEDISRKRRKAIEAKSTAIPGLWGPLPPEWHVRDTEGYIPGVTKCLHYTTIHAQPWYPVPERYVYLPNPVGRVWHELERSADRAAFKVFTAEHPSRGYEELLARYRIGGGAGSAPSPQLEGMADLLRQAGAQTIVDYGLGGGEGKGQARKTISHGTGQVVTRFDGSLEPNRSQAPEPAGAVVCADELEFLPNDDVPWFVERLFDRAQQAVYATIADYPRSRVLPDGTTWTSRPQPQSWWLAYFEAASARRPQVRWRVAFQARTATGRRVVRIRDGGGRHGRPRMWVPADDKGEHTAQAGALADALGWPYETKEIRFNTMSRVSNRLLGASRFGLDRSGSASLSPPWPDLVIAAGRRSAPIARWIGAQSNGRTRLVQLGRKGGDMAEAFDAVVTCSYLRLPIHRRRIETVASLSGVTPERLAKAARRFADVFAHAPAPHVILIAGGTSGRYRLDAETARRIGKQVRLFAESHGGSALAIATRLTGSDAIEALCVGLGGSDRLRYGRPGALDDLYLAHLAAADAIVVSGDSELMLADAAAAGKPMYIYPLPEKRRGLRLRLRQWVVEKAYSRPRKAKGTVRPQQGLEYVCARLIQRGIVRPPRDLALLHEELIRRGVARRFGEPLAGGGQHRLHEASEVAARVREMLGFRAFSPMPRGTDESLRRGSAA